MNNQVHNVITGDVEAPILVVKGKRQSGNVAVRQEIITFGIGKEIIQAPDNRILDNRPVVIHGKRGLKRVRVDNDAYDDNQKDCKKIFFIGTAYTQNNWLRDPIDVGIKITSGLKNKSILIAHLNPITITHTNDQQKNIQLIPWLIQKIASGDFSPR